MMPIQTTYSDPYGTRYMPAGYTPSPNYGDPYGFNYQYQQEGNPYARGVYEQQRQRAQSAYGQRQREATAGYGQQAAQAGLAGPAAATFATMAARPITEAYGQEMAGLQSQYLGDQAQQLQAERQRQWQEAMQRMTGGQAAGLSAQEAAQRQSLQEMLGMQAMQQLQFPYQALPGGGETPWEMQQEAQRQQDVFNLWGQILSQEGEAPYAQRFIDWLQQYGGQGTLPSGHPSDRGGGYLTQPPPMAGGPPTGPGLPGERRQGTDGRWYQADPSGRWTLTG